MNKLIIVTENWKKMKKLIIVTENEEIIGGHGGGTLL